MPKYFRYDPASAAPTSFDPVTRTFVIKNQGQEVKVAYADVNSLVAHLYQTDQSVVPVGEEPWSRGLYTLDQTVRGGDRHRGAEALIGLNTDVLPAMGVHFYPNTDLSGMPKREGIGAAGFSLVDGLRRFAGSFRFFDTPVAEVQRSAENASYLAVLRDGFFSLERTVGANELKVLPLLRDWILDAVDDLGDKLTSIPLLGQAMAAAVHYATDSVNQAAETARRGRARRAEETKRLEETVAAQAREEGRNEATRLMKERLGVAAATK